MLKRYEDLTFAEIRRVLDTFVPRFRRDEEIPGADLVDDLGDVLRVVGLVDDYDQSDEAKAVRYLDGGGEFCPQCGEKDVATVDEPQFADGATAFQQCRCGSCSARWTDEFHLANVGFDEPDEDEDEEEDEDDDEAEA